MKKHEKPIALLLTLVILTGFFTGMGSLQANALTSTEQADALKAGGLFLGTGTGYDLPGVLTRVQGITLALRAQGLEQVVMAQSEATVAVTLARLTDLEKIPDWARKYVAYALVQEPAITRGVAVLADGRVTFAPDLKMSGTQFITFMIRAMGYEATLDGALDLAATTQMLPLSLVAEYGVAQEFTRGQAVSVMYNAMAKGIVKQTGKPLAETLLAKGVLTTAAAIGLGYMEPVATPTPTPTPGIYQRLAVQEVKALNTKQLEVTFNKPVSDRKSVV